ncbi:MAG: peptidase S58 family protein [Rhodobacteraceae bacterium]|nr:MAG: peptidase S58 family protein [Paracoccaceae bacterium]
MSEGPGPQNLITDIAGLRLGHEHCPLLRSGVTVLVGDRPILAAVHVMGGAPGTRETELLAPDRLVQQVDALVLAGGSAFGLDAASGVMDGLRAMGRGFDVGGMRVPIVPAAILFDLNNGGNKSWAQNPYADLGRAALAAASVEVALGSVGAGFGASTARLKGGFGSASWVLRSGTTVGAAVAVNPVGCVTMGQGPEFWANPFEQGAEFGGLGMGVADAVPVTKRTREATTLAIIATDAVLTQAQLTRVAIAAHDGIARAIVPAHTPFDGDLVFAVSTATGPEVDEVGLLDIGHAAATCLTRAIARGIYEAHTMPGDLLPSWRARFG